MIEVEIRGKLTGEEYQKLKNHLEKEGTYEGSHDREMILLRGYPGFSEDPNARSTDIRLRTTNNDLEIMVKHKVSDNNVGREEISLGLITGSDTESVEEKWKNAKKVLKALGYGSGLWMQRNKELYRFHDIEWSLVDATGGYFYFEAEIEVSESDSINTVHEKLVAEAEALGLAVLNPEEMKEFIFMLDKAVNKEIEW